MKSLIVLALLSIPSAALAQDSPGSQPNVGPTTMPASPPDQFVKSANECVGAKADPVWREGKLVGYNCIRKDNGS